mmetsp:Transcript_43875/g.138509  ORF Transcript_43875/g.138509 Transcript_43875/m.138509 type:complete len:82 (+) Transcript_43875:1174-1419(+)
MYYMCTEVSFTGTESYDDSCNEKFEIVLSFAASSAFPILENDRTSAFVTWELEVTAQTSLVAVLAFSWFVGGVEDKCSFKA